MKLLYFIEKVEILNNPQKKKIIGSAKVPFSGIYNTKKFKFVVTQGNNSKLIKEAMRKRSWWVEIPNFNTAFNFKWQPTSHRIKFLDLPKDSNSLQTVNHFEFHKSLSEKSELFENLQQYSEQIKTNVFKIMPLTFFINIDMKKPNAVNSSLIEFLSVFTLFESSRKKFKKIETEKTTITEEDFILNK